MRLHILISICFIGIVGSNRCIHQVRTRTVQPGGSVTIPCSYSVTEEPEGNVQIVWTETDGDSCSDVKWIFASSGNVIEKYKGRLHREKDPNRNKTTSITITPLEPTDGPRFCCRLYQIKSNQLFKGNKHGTALQFPEEEHVTQLDELIAVSGEEVIIPCYYSKDSLDITYVTWGYADRENYICTKINTWNWDYQYDRYSLVNFTQDVSLRIRKIQQMDQKHYCCDVYTPGEIITDQRTKLMVADYKSSWDEMATEITVEKGHSVNLTCSHTIPNGPYTESNVVRVNVYWRVGNVTGPYAYHPYQEMVHSAYVHRTSITGMTNLMINNVTNADSNSFHCFVVVKLCADDDQYEDTIEYGGGIRLIVNGKAKSLQDNKDPPFPIFMIIIAISLVALLIFLIGILCVLKVKGVICKKKPQCSQQQMDSIPTTGDVTSEELPYCEIRTKKSEDIPVVGTDEADMKEIEGGQMEDGEDGNLLYAKLNKTKLEEKHPNKKHPKQTEEVVYAAVANTASD